jgi:starch-binding outer membrane protein, SusD/RagB family
MKKINHTIFALFLVATLLIGCKKDFLSFDYNEGPISENDVWSSDRLARGFLNSCYSGLQSRYDLGSGAMLSMASDEAVCSNLSNSVNIMNNGTWGPLRTFDDRYSTVYGDIRATNIFLEKAPGSFIFPATDIPKLRGEAFFLRAFFHFELFKRYGRIVVATRSFKTEENLNIPRNTIEEVIKQISDDCDSAVNLIDVAWSRDWDNANRGRATQAAALALKSRALLYAASPLYNPTNDVTKWQAAADAAKALIDMNKHGLLSANDLVKLWDFSNGATQYNKEVIFATVATNTNSIESNNAPTGFTGGLGRTNPTQDLVDAFEMSNGKLITDPASGYNPSNPYAGRDPRLNRFIVYNGATFKTGSLSRAVETFEGGKDNLAINVNSTKTGYYMRKFLSEGASFNVTGPASIRRPWVIFRYAEILLNYAEALNEATGNSPEVEDAVNQVRKRVGMPVLPTGLPQSEMRERIRNERRVELCFEEHRFFDARRWKMGETLFNGPVRGMKSTKDGSVLTYEPFVVENRIFEPKNYLYPLLQSEVNKAPELQQNPGY